MRCQWRTVATHEPMTTENVTNEIAISFWQDRTHMTCQWRTVATHELITHENVTNEIAISLWQDAYAMSKTHSCFSHMSSWLNIYIPAGLWMPQIIATGTDAGKMCQRYNSWLINTYEFVAHQHIWVRAFMHIYLLGCKCPKSCNGRRCWQNVPAICWLQLFLCVTNSCVNASQTHVFMRHELMCVNESRTHIISCHWCWQKAPAICWLQIFRCVTNSCVHASQTHV